MPKSCPVCVHTERQAIEKALLRSERLHEITQRYGVSKRSLFNHRDSHLPQQLKKAQKAEEMTQADSLLRQVLYLQSRALTILKTAEASGDLKTALGAIREARGNLELLAKLMGEIKEGTSVNILISPAWVSLRTVILQALEPYPEVKLKLSQVLKGVDNATGN
jgi:hypothetical protein